MPKFGNVVAVLGSAGIILPAYLMQSKNETLWKNVTMPLLRTIDAENAHRLAVKAASWGLVPKFTTEEKDESILKTSLLGLTFDSPIGMAAGFDKHAECFDGLLKMGFGFVEVGSVTPKPQDGNEKSRVFRLPEDGAIINRYGFNSFGHQYAFDNLSKKRISQKGVVAVNLGKNKTTADDVDDYVQGVVKFGELADYLVINISSPNTPGLRDMQRRKQLEGLLEKVLDARNKLQKRPPLFLKIAPDLSEQDKEDIVAVIKNPKTNVDGLIISNTTVTRPDTLQNVNKQEIGGLSGKPLKNLSTQIIRDMYRLTQGTVPIIGVGGVSSGEDAYEKICSGASLIQLYSSLALEGPPVLGKVKRELADLLRKDGFSSVSDAVGCDVLEFHCPTGADFVLLNKTDEMKELLVEEKVDSVGDVTPGKTHELIDKTIYLGYIVTNIAAVCLLFAYFQFQDTSSI